MKMKKFILSFVLLIFVCLLLVDVPGKKLPVPVKEVSHGLEVIEYEEKEYVPEIETEEEVVQEDSISICVFGKSQISLSPDSAKINACIESIDVDMKKSKDDNFKTFEKVVEALKEIDVKDDEIVLNRFNCYPNYDYREGRKILGYCSNCCFTVNVNSLDKIKECVNVLTKDGVTVINDISYQVSDIDEQYNTALTQAVENAKEKAENILGKSDLKIVSVKEEVVHSCNSLLRNYSEDLSASNLIGKVDIEAMVLVEFN